MFPYQKLNVYKKAFLVNSLIYNFLKGNPKIPAYAKNQLGRSSMSIVLNIAEGSAKFAKRDRRNFYVIARGSVFESAAMIEVLLAENEISKELKAHLEKGLEEISVMLYTMIKNLEN